MKVNTLQGLKLAAYAFFAWLNIDMETFGILIILMTLDSFFGAIKAVRFKKEFKFKTLIWGLCLKMCFLIIPLIVALLGKGVGGDFYLGVDIVMKILIVSEGYSIFGNIYAAKNKKEVKSIDIISILLKSLRVGLKGILDKLLNRIENAGDCGIKK